MFMASNVDLPAHTGQDILILCLHILWGHCMYVIRVYIDCITQGNDDDELYLFPLNYLELNKNKLCGIKRIK